MGQNQASKAPPQQHPEPTPRKHSKRKLKPKEISTEFTDLERLQPESVILTARSPKHENIIKEDPHNGEMLNYLGKLEFRAGQKKEALMHLRKALILKECDAEGCYLLALLYEDKKRYEDAIETLHSGLELNGEHHKSLVKLSQFYTNKSDFDKGLHFAFRGVRVEQNAELCNTIGLCYYGKANKSKKQNEEMLNLAAQFYQKAIEQDANYSQAYNNLGNVFRQQGSLAEAIEVYQRAIEINQAQKEREYYIAHLNLGTVLIDTGMVVEGVHHLKIAFSKRHKQIEGVLKRSGMILFFQHSGIRRALRALYAEDYGEAIRELQACEDLCSRNVVHQFLMGKGYEGLQFLEQAKLYYVKVIKIAQNEERLLQTRFCAKVIQQAKDSLRNLSNAEGRTPLIFGVAHKIAGAQEEFESQLIREDDTTTARPSLCRRYISKPKNKGTVNERNRQIMAVNHTDPNNMYMLTASLMTPPSSHEVRSQNGNKFIFPDTAYETARSPKRPEELISLDNSDPSSQSAWQQSYENSGHIIGMYLTPERKDFGQRKQDELVVNRTTFLKSSTAIKGKQASAIHHMEVPASQRSLLYRSNQDFPARKILDLTSPRAGVREIDFLVQQSPRGRSPRIIQNSSTSTQEWLKAKHIGAGVRQDSSMLNYKGQSNTQDLYVTTELREGKGLQELLES